jgi:hypothetical protein
MRDIKRDEEITFDYSTTIVDDWHIECHCGAASCRGFIGRYRNLPDELKAKDANFTPEWIKSL